MEASICIPTKNESERIGGFLDRLSERVAESRHTFTVIIIDSSTDRTAEIAAAHQVTDTVEHCEEDGILHARHHGVERAKTGTVVAMDADVTYFPEFLNALLQPFTTDETSP